MLLLSISSAVVVLITLTPAALAIWAYCQSRRTAKRSTAQVITGFPPRPAPNPPMPTRIPRRAVSSGRVMPSVEPWRKKTSADSGLLWIDSSALSRHYDSVPQESHSHFSGGSGDFGGGGASASYDSGGSDSGCSSSDSGSCSGGGD